MVAVVAGVLGVVAAALLGLWVTTRQKASTLQDERDRARNELSETTAELSSTNQRLAESEGRLSDVASAKQELAEQHAELGRKQEETADTLRKRTDLADAQAMQIHELSAERDDLRQQLTSAEERIVTLAARPGVVVGEMAAEEANAEMLWDLEVARSERAWRNSVAINPVADASPFKTTEDPVRTAVEIEAAALREDVGALINVEWKAEPIESASRRLLVVRVAQEMLSSASRAPGAARLVVTQSSESDGDLKMEFESADDSEVINLIPPQLSSDLIDVRSEAGLSITVKAD